MKRQILIPRDFDDNDISKWGLPPGAIRRFGQGYASDMAFCSHNGVVAVTTTEGVWWYKLPTLSPVALWKKEDETAMFSSCTFSQDGRFFAAGGLDASRVLSLAFSPDNTILASSGTDGTILLWDMKPYLKNT